MRARVPIVPVAVVGAEEAMPIFAHISALQRLTGLLYFPITPTFPHLGLAGFLGYLPAKFKIRFLEPIPTDQWGEEPWQDRGLIQTVADEIRGRIQEELIDMLAHRRIGLVRMSRILVTGVSSFWGGRLAQALERDESVETIIGVEPARPDARARAHGVRPRRHAARAAAADRAGGGDRHGDRLAAGRGLDPGLPARGARDQRDRDDEHPRGLRRAGLARAQGRLQVLRALLRLRARRPGVLHRGDAAPAPAAHAPGVGHRGGRERRPRRSPSATRTSP